ncbi:L-rhamnose-binding lectin CSL3-like [Branchiostoma floridae]|uniref:L-rhamnose-binding lectin CSL3-like n=1 Tax=Branchiostoma floridae TaxID=7739 RepID=A0A9J7HVG1_BRAFL|nr:L-rhamnose-binding lectin CSL3-like [Branchiostoma floridae]
MINVTRALYGRTQRELCDGPVSTTSCRSSSSLSTVRAYCQGHRTCSVPASNSVFGDPCQGTVKYLEVSYKCIGQSCAECDQICTYANDDTQCFCYAGYIFNENGACDDVNECLRENGGCEHVCTNTEGSFQCSCNPGYLLSDNGFSCDDPCLTARPLYEPHRSTAYITESGGSTVCDGGLEEDWYRFTHVGGTIPTSCVQSYRCGTESPVWLNGEHPTDDTIADRSVCANTGVPGECCTEQYNIQVKRCPTPGHTYYVYKLVSTNYCEAYCAEI